MQADRRGGARGRPVRHADLRERPDRGLHEDRSRRVGTERRRAAGDSSVGRVRDGEAERPQRLSAAGARLPVFHIQRHEPGRPRGVGRSETGRPHRSNRVVRQPLSAQSTAAPRRRTPGKSGSVRAELRRAEKPADRLRADQSAAALQEVAPVLFIALGVWWIANTIAHLFIHRPFFQRRLAIEAFATLLSVALGFPQAIWRDRHLAHHAGRHWRLTLSREILLQASLVLLFWTALARLSPAFFFATYLPGYVGGLA